MFSSMIPVLPYIDHVLTIVKGNVPSYLLGGGSHMSNNYWCHYFWGGVVHVHDGSTAFSLLSNLFLLSIKYVRY